MADPMERSGRGERLMRAMFSDEAIAQAAALEKSLEPDPAADPVTRIDQEWIRESRRYTATNRYGVVKAPDVTALRRSILILTVLGGGMMVMGFVFQKGFACFGLFLMIFFVAPLLLGLRQANRYQTAAGDYRQRRSAALASMGRAAAAAAPLPVVDEPVWIAKGVMDLEASITRLHDEYGLNGMWRQEYERSQAALLAAAPEHERPFFEALNQLERDWASERGRLVAVYSVRRRRYRVLPTVEAARQRALVGLIAPLLMAVFFAAVGASLPIVLAPVILAGLMLYGAWSLHQKAERYQVVHAEYLRRREQLLASRRWQQRSGG